MLNLLKGGAEQTFTVIERELRCGVWSWNLRTGEMQWSRGYYDLLGIEPGKVTPSFASILQVTHPEDRGAQAEIERVIRKASTVRRKFRIIRQGGSIAWIYCQIIVFVDSDGASDKALGVCTEITAREDQLNSLRVADERYRALIRATGAVVWIARSDGDIHEVLNCEHNPAQALALNAGWLQLVHPDDRDKIVRVQAEARREKRGYEVVHRVGQGDGSFKWKRSTGQPVLDELGNIKEWLGFSVDFERRVERARTQVTGAQIRAARGLLRWSVLDLAQAAEVSRATIRRIEELDGAASHDDPALPLIEAAFSKAGVEFLFPEVGKPGVRPR